MDQIINSLLEIDTYKFSMGQAIYHQFPSYTTTWSFKCRNTDVKFTHEMVEEIRSQIRAYCDLRFDEEELRRIMDKSCSSVEIVKDLQYENNWMPGLFSAWIGTVKD